MKKLLIFLPIMFVVTLVFANKLFYSNSTKLVNKEINLAIYTDNNYSAAAYDNSLAQVAITVIKVNGNTYDTAMVKTFNAKQLKQYTTAKNAFTEKINISNVKDDKEYLVVSYTVHYDTKGSKLTAEKYEFVTKGENNKKIDVVI